MRLSLLWLVRRVLAIDRPGDTAGRAAPARRPASVRNRHRLAVGPAADAVCDRRRAGRLADRPLRHRAGLGDGLADQRRRLGRARGVTRMRSRSTPRPSSWRPACRSCSRRCRRWCGPGFRSASASPPRSTPTDFSIGETLAVALTIPLVLPLVDDSWRLSFVVWSAPVVLTALLVVVCASWLGGATTAAVATERRWWPDWRQPLIWRLGLILGSVNAMYFVTNAFLPDYVTAAGRPDLIGPVAHRAQSLPVAGLLPDARPGRAAGESSPGPIA